MNGNLSKQKILNTIARLISSNKQPLAKYDNDAILKFSNLKNKEKFFQYLISLHFNNYLESENLIDGTSFSSLKDKGRQAVANNYFKQQNYNTLWRGVKDWSIVIANILVATVAIYALSINKRNDYKIIDSIKLLQSKQSTTQLKLQKLQLKFDTVDSLMPHK